jgi:formylglycine-generating enzyme required for sulfatase activity
MSDLDFGATIRGFSPNQKVFQRYTLQKILGRGGMGVVWLAKDEKLAREVALKFLPEIVVLDPKAVEELKTEARRNLDLTHPGIVRIQDFIDDAHMAAIAMEYVDGTTFSKLGLERPGGVFAVEELKPWVEQLCAALDYAHGDAQVVHRDIKPANLMINSRGRLKVTDFGIARSISDSVSRVSVQAGTSGTPVYMSPQQMMGEKSAVTDDIYALGATLYELLTGKPPFYTGNIIAQVQGKVPPSLKARREELNVLGAEVIPPEWEETIAACLAKEASARPQSAGEVAGRLRLAGGLKVMPKPASKSAVVESVPSAAAKLADPAETVERSKIKSKSRLYAGLVAALLIFGGAGFYFLSYAPEQQRVAVVKRLEAEKKRQEQEAAARLTAVAAEKAARLAAARGGLTIRTEPVGAEVTVGALEQGPSPLRIKEAKLGKYPVKAKLAGYEDWSGDIEVKENEFAELSAALVRSTGNATITSEPSGLSYVLTGKEKTERGKTPATLTQLPTGSYTLTITREGWPEVTQTMTVARGAAASARAEFPSGNLEITSTPSGAEVYAEGRKIGVTPMSFGDLPPSAYAYEFRLKGYKPASVRGEINAGATARASATLEKRVGAEEGQAWTIPDLNLTLVPIAQGMFAMGDGGSGEADEKPVTRVTLTRPYWLGKTEVTQRQYETVMGSNPSHFKGESLPVERVSWEEAMEFCRRLSEREEAAGRLPLGYVYTLPTEAQWEYGCRAGTTGDYAGDLNAMGWYSQNSGNTTRAVAIKQANAWGLYDMHGNVWEWCADWKGDYVGGTVTDPRGASSGTLRVFRGGGWFNGASGCRSALRNKIGPSDRFTLVGFRLALSSVP